MFAANMQSQQLLRDEQQQAQRIAATCEQRLRDVEQMKDRELAALHARATQALRDQQAKHDQELNRVRGELEREHERTQTEQKKALELQAEIDRLREDKQQAGGANELDARELERASADARELRLEVGVLSQKLIQREAFYQAEKSRLRMEECGYDTEVEKAQLAWKEHAASLQKRLDEAWAEQARLQDELQSLRSRTTSVPAEGASRIAQSELRSSFASAPALSPPLPDFGAWDTQASAGGSCVAPVPAWPSAGTAIESDAFGAANTWPAGSQDGGARRRKGGRKRDGGGSRGSSPAVGPGEPGGAPGHKAAAGSSQTNELVGMGFSEERVQQVLLEVGGDMDLAVSRLLGAPAPAVSLPETPGTAPRSRRRGEARSPRSGGAAGKKPTAGEWQSVVDPAIVAEIVGMGFTQEQAEEALALAGGDAEAALHMLLA